MEASCTDRKSFYQVLTRKIRFLIFLVSFSPMVLTTGILFYRFNLSYTEKIQAHISELVQKHTQNIDYFLSEKLKNIRYLSRHLNTTSKTPKDFLKDNLNLLKNEYGDAFTDLGLINQDGIQFAYEGPFNLENADYANAEWFRKSMERPYYISDVFAGLRGRPHFIIAVKVRAKGADCILRSTINFGAFNSLVGNIHIGKTGVAFIINAKGQLQTKTDVSFKKTSILQMVDRQYYQKSKTVFAQKQEDLGHEYLYVTSMLKNIDWVMVFRQDMADAFNELRKTQLISSIIFFIGCIAIVSVVFALPRKIIGLISNADKKNEAMNKQVVESGKLATIGELAAGIAHEINNPVAIMVEEAGWIGDLLEEEDLKEAENLEEFNRALAQINTQGRRCKEITHKLLSFARKTDSTLNDVQVNDAIREIVSFSAQIAKYNNVIIETSLDESVPYIRVSPSELQQVILNLINNAIDAMEKKGGVIRIETWMSREEKKYLMISIEDNGPGIPKDNLDRIFDPFFTTKSVGKGTGLGLSICYGIIQKMGGKIEVHSQVDAGTKFHIGLPFNEDNIEINSIDKDKLTKKIGEKI